MSTGRITAIALLAATPATAQQAAPAAAPSPAAVTAGTMGTTLTSKSAAGAVTIAVDKAQDGRLSIRIVAANFGTAPASFGPASVMLQADGRPVRLATADDLVGRDNGHTGRDSTLARLAAAPNIPGFGQRDTTQDDNPNESTSGIPGERYGRADRASDTDERDRLRLALLRPTEVAPHGHQGGALLTDRLRGGARTLDLSIAFAGDTYRFAVRLSGK